MGIITEDDLDAEWMTSQNQIPGPKDGLLNEINKNGLMTYTDFHFLFLLMSTPRRYVDMIFHAFDVSADGNIEAKEFIYILAKIANVKTDPEELMKSQKSGLVRYLFGEKLDGELQKETFKDLQSKLIDDVLSLEFTRYCSKTEKMTEEDFCRHMLYTSSLTSKKKEKMLARVSKRFKGKGPGIAFTSFKNFYNVLFGGADLERAWTLKAEESTGKNLPRSQIGFAIKNLTLMWWMLSTHFSTRTVTRISALVSSTPSSSSGDTREVSRRVLWQCLWEISSFKQKTVRRFVRHI